MLPSLANMQKLHDLVKAKVIQFGPEVENYVAKLRTTLPALLGEYNELPRYKTALVTDALCRMVGRAKKPQEVFDECTEMHPVKRIGTPQEIAELILYLCGPNAGFITGQAIRIDGGLGLSIGGSKRG